MSYNTSIVSLAFICAVVAGAGIVTSSWEAKEKSNNVFAEQCNARGGKAVFDAHGRQCIGAKGAQHG